jgi:ribonucleoside-triphosphate reductase
LEYIKLYGLDDLVNLQTASKPANHMSTLVGHMNTFMSSLACYYAGAIGFGFLNIFLAPLVYEDRMSYSEVLQNMQYLWYSASQNSFSRGGQALFTDMNFTLEIPSYFRDVRAVGKSGKYIDKTYGELEAEAQLVLEAVIEIISKGDKYGVPFAFPKADININANSFIVPKQKELMMKLCEAASLNGSPYFVFDDRNAGGEATVSQCCRLRSKITDPDVLKHPEKLRFCGVQNVTINLPQCAYRGRGKVEKVVEEVEWAMDLAMKAHLQKKKFLETLMKPNNPLYQLGKVFKDGSSYVDLEKSTYIIGMVGLNECVQFITGKQLHEDEETFKLGLKIISHMYIKAKKLEKENGLKVTLEESPAESATYRLAKCDLREYPESKFLIKGDIDTGNQIYYTNSVHLVADANVSLIDRIVKQAKFHPLIESGAITHIFLGEQKPDALGIYNLMEKVWKNTQTAQITISPEFTICNDCHKVSRGWARQ